MKYRSRLGAISLATLAFITTASAQFKEVGPAPFPPQVAHERIRQLLDTVNSSNRQQTIRTLIGWLAWYRDILDEELIAAWKRDSRVNPPEVLRSLADPQVASAVIEFSWRQRTPANFNLSYAPLFVDLMERFPQSAKPFLDDLMNSPDLPEPDAETVCRILVDMPDVGDWKANAQRILPHYRKAAEAILVQDQHSGDEDKSYQAQVWLAELRGESNRQTNAPPAGRRRIGVSQPSVIDRGPVGGQETATAAPPPTSVAPRVPMPATAAVAAPSSGTLESSGGDIPQNAEYVFRDLPPGAIRLEYDKKIWDARVSPGIGGTQRVIVRNKSSGPQKRCVIHWSVSPN